MTYRKIVAILMAALILFSVAACGGTDTPAETTAGTTASESTKLTSASTTAETTTAETTTEYEPKIDMDGYDFVLAVGNAGRFTPEPGSSELHDKWQAEYNEIEDKFNCKFTVFGHSTNTESLMQYVLSGDKMGDFVFMRQTNFYTFAIKGYLRSLTSPEVVNAGFNVYDETRWFQPTTLLAEFNDNIWGVDTCSEYYICKFGFFLVFNKDLVNNEAGYSSDTMYQMVRDHKWNWDKYVEIAKSITKDLDADNKPDQWGIGDAMKGHEIFTNGTQPIIEKDGRWVSNFKDGKVIEALEFMQDVWYNEGIKDPEETNGTNLRQRFADGQVGMTFVYGSNMRDGDQINESTHDYGVLPLPMGPNASEYVSVLDGLDVWTLFTSNPDYEKSVTIMNAFGARMTDDNWKEGIREQWFRDDESMEVFENYILPNTVINTSSPNDPINNYCRKEIYPQIQSGEIRPSTAVESLDQVIVGMLEDMFG